MTRRALLAGGRSRNDRPTHTTAMRTLLILRHAKSSWDDSSLADHDRPLNRRGRKAAPRMGRLLREERLLPDWIIGSTALRVRETVESLAKEADYRGPIEFRPELYLAAAEDYVQALGELPDACRRAMVVGHNPGLECLLENLTGAREQLPTAALAQVELAIERWDSLAAAGGGRLVNLWRPKELDE